MGYRHSHWYDSGTIYSGTNPHIQLLVFVLTILIVPMNFFLAVLLSAVGCSSLWIPLVCIEIVGLFLYRWYKP